ncbi:putative F-box protein At3g10430 [Rutidosis leptorrhynchoides]|uniref:putative F-box protein At3g10430 n=1 Tax=Rutidosis leptorrhynchoides TaxID=125765 RepID=UPI003A993698
MSDYYLPLEIQIDFGDFPYWYQGRDEAKTYVLWNPMIQKSVPIVVPGDENYMEFKSVVGFGVCPRTSVPKLVKITFISRSPSIKNRTPQVEIFSLSSGSWRRSLSTNVPRKSIDLDRNHVCVDKCIYWYAFDRTVTGETYQNKNLILSFDMTTEEFSEIDLCDGLKEEYAGDAYGCYGYLSISKLGTSLVVLQPKDGYYEEHSVWRMEHGVPNSFTKLFVIKSPIESLRIHRVHDFRKPGEPIIKTKKLVVFEPESGEISDIGNSCCDYSSIAKSYIVTLVLLDS